LGDGFVGALGGGEDFEPLGHLLLEFPGGAAGGGLVADPGGGTVAGGLGLLAAVEPALGVGVGLGLFGGAKPARLSGADPLEGIPDRVGPRSG
jgi:hypothetical protein